MENKLLQLTLQASLLDIGDSDKRLENIEQSIADLQAKLTKESSLLINYTLISLYPNISSEELVLAEVETKIVTHWKALPANFMKLLFQ